MTRCQKVLCTSAENKTLLKTFFIWNVVMCICMNECIYSTDNFSNQAVVDFKIVITHWKSAKKWPPKTDIHVLIDFRHLAYKQIASTWRNNHWFVRVRFQDSHHTLKNYRQKLTSMYRVIFVTLFTNKSQAHGETITDLYAENMVLYGQYNINTHYSCIFDQLVVNVCPVLRQMCCKLEMKTLNQKMTA